MGVGNYQGGHLWVQDKGAVDCSRQFVQFDGNVPHCTLPFLGTRYTFIYFTQQSYELVGHLTPI